MSPRELAQLRAEVEAAMVAALIVKPKRVEHLQGWFQADWLEYEQHVWLVQALLEGVSLRAFAETCSPEERAYFRALAGCLVNEDVRHYGLALHSLRQRDLEEMAKRLLDEAAKPVAVSDLGQGVRHAA